MKVWGKRPGLFVNNSRFYILLLSVLLSLGLVFYLRTNIENTQLYYIRLQQVCGFLALFFWYFALLATPLSKVFGKEGFMKQYLYVRRALGVSAAYFATLHVLISLFGQLGGIDGLGLLPDRFKQALLFGAIGLLFLLLMTATSFDKVVDWMTFPRWKWLHRTGYIAAILVFLHVWMIGTHLAYPWVRWSLFFLLILLAGLESWRTAKNMQKKFRLDDTSLFVAIFISIFMLGALFIICLPTFVESYHETHAHSEIGR